MNVLNKATQRAIVNLKKINTNNKKLKSILYLFIFFLALSLHFWMILPWVTT